MGVVQSLEYDPFRNCHIALVCYRLVNLKVICYILAPEGIGIGDKIFASDTTPIRLGNTLLLANIPFNVKIYNIEASPGGGASYVRSAGG